MIVADLQKHVSQALESLGIKSPEVQFEHPAELAHGDYSTNAALRYAKEVQKRSKELAEVIVRYIVLQRLPFVEKVETAGAGFINFYLSEEFFTDEVKKIVKSSSRSDLSPDLRSDLKGKRVMVEYTDPNPFKEFHIGHLMSNAVGESIARIFEYHGAKVLRACWQGDVGLHVAKAVFGYQKLYRAKPNQSSVAQWGKAYATGSEAYETDEAAKKEINELNKKIFERSDNEINKLYDAGRKVSLEHFEEIYKVLDTKFDYRFFESKEGVEGAPIVQEYLKKGVFERSDGAIVFKGEPHGLHTRVFINSQGLPTYEAKELGLNKRKFELEPRLEKSIIVTGNEINEYFKVLLKVMSLVMPNVAAKTVHLSHGMLRLSSGKMSSRKGNVITGESLIEQVKEMVHAKLKDRDMPEAEKGRVAEVVAVGAIKYSILRQAIGGDIVFDFEKSISFEGDSGPYLQYSCVRAKSVLQKAACSLSPTSTAAVEVGLKLKQTPTTLERLLYRFPEIVERAGTGLEPHYIATFLTELAGAFNSWYAKEQIVDVNDPASPYKVALTDAFATTMQNGLWLLGIKVPEKM